MSTPDNCELHKCNVFEKWQHFLLQSQKVYFNVNNCNRLINDVVDNSTFMYPNYSLVLNFGQ